MNRVHGQIILDRFDHQVSQQTRAIDALETQIVSAETAISTANKIREDAYVELAGFYCDEKDRLKHELVAVSRELQFQFDAKNQRRREVEADLARWDQLIEQAMAELRQARAARDAAAGERESASARVEAELGGDPKFQEAKAAGSTAQQRQASESAAALSVKREVRKKISEFEKNRFFMYLLKRAYGTANYKAFSWVRRGDDWLAEKLLWIKNYANYSMLKELPKQVEARAAEAVRVHQLAAARVALRIQEAERNNGATEAKQRLERRCHTVFEIEARIVEHAARREVLLQERKALETNRDPFVNKAKEAIKAMLTGESIQALKARAQRTQAGRDAVLASTIEQAEAAVNEGRLSVKKFRQERNEAEQKQKRALVARGKFSSEYTNTYDYFDAGGDLDNLLGGYVAGRTSERDFWGAVEQRHHDETPAPTYSFSSDSSDSSGFSFGGDSGGSSFGGGGDSGGSSFGGGD